MAELSYEERAAEIAGRILVAMVTSGGNNSSAWTTSEETGKKNGVAARLAFKEVYEGVLGCLQGE